MQWIEFLRLRPSWQKDALCHEYRHVNFFPKLGEPTEPAKQVCDRCAVKAECLAYALDDNDITAGIWGGTSNKQRKQLRTQGATDAPL